MKMEPTLPPPTMFVAQQASPVQRPAAPRMLSPRMSSPAYVPRMAGTPQGIQPESPGSTASSASTVLYTYEGYPGSPFQGTLPPARSPLGSIPSILSDSEPLVGTGLAGFTGFAPSPRPQFHPSEFIGRSTPYASPGGAQRESTPEGSPAQTPGRTVSVPNPASPTLEDSLHIRALDEDEIYRPSRPRTLQLQLWGKDFFEYVMLGTSLHVYCRCLLYTSPSPRDS